MGKADSKSRTQQGKQQMPGEDEMRLPPRRVIHATDNTKATRIFHASLVVLLILLTMGIIFWYQMYGE
ncbi:hypothetical protein D7M11_11515 [Paenibacillus ginsengarvi]|uniref:Uncharacterized protein n=1 Tax=Paenibacillus ginsengarvi TaxID=400777 RepID=A0A3B0CJV3_9BACL|nr:hypothetical protein D7M11_11515 [Paenibacillus ginsengarvi]